MCVYRPFFLNSSKNQGYTCTCWDQELQTKGVVYSQLLRRPPCIWVDGIQCDFVGLAYGLDAFIILRHSSEMFSSESSSEARTSRDHFFLSPDFHELWHSRITTCLITEVKAAMGYARTAMGDRFSALLHYGSGCIWLTFPLP